MHGTVFMVHVTEVYIFYDNYAKLLVESNAYFRGNVHKSMSQSNLFQCLNQFTSFQYNENDLRFEV